MIYEDFTLKVKHFRLFLIPQIHSQFIVDIVLHTFLKISWSWSLLCSIANLMYCYKPCTLWFSLIFQFDLGTMINQWWWLHRCLVFSPTNQWIKEENNSVDSKKSSKWTILSFLNFLFFYSLLSVLTRSTLLSINPSRIRPSSPPPHSMSPEIVLTIPRLQPWSNDPAPFPPNTRF